VESLKLKRGVVIITESWETDQTFTKRLKTVRKQLATQQLFGIDNHNHIHPINFYTVQLLPPQLSAFRSSQTLACTTPPLHACKRVCLHAWMIAFLKALNG
jgi:hypothetical protein